MTINKPQARSYLKQMTKCLHSVRGKVKHYESGHTIVLLLNANEISGERPFARGCLAMPGRTQGYQSNMVSFLIDTGSQVSILSLSHLKQMGINSQKIHPVQTSYVNESSTEVKYDCIIGKIKLTIFQLEKHGNFCFINT